MAGEAIVVPGTPKTLEASGASTANNVVTQANDATYNIVADGASFPDAKFVFSGAFATAPTKNSVIGLYARPLNIDGTADTEVPEATRPTVWIGSFIMNNVTTAQYCELIARDVPWEAEYYIHNNNTGQTLSAGWTLKVTPFSYKAA
jgi:hypothetical protein